MKNKILGLLIAFLVAFCFSVSLFTVNNQKVNAVIHGYSVFVGGIEVNENNASDVLEDGTVSYDTATKTLTLNNANLAEYCTQAQEGYCGIYSDLDGLVINLVGTNKITEKEDAKVDSIFTIYSSKSIKITGRGSLETDYDVGVYCSESVVIENASVAFLGAGIETTEGTVTLKNATLSSKDCLVSTGGGAIYVNGSTVTADSETDCFQSETGSLFMENSSIKGKAETLIYLEVSPHLVIKNSTLEVTASLAGIFLLEGDVELEDVTADFKVYGEAAYGIYAGKKVSVKNCALNFECDAQEDSGLAISSEKRIEIEASEIKIDLSAKETALGIGVMFEIGDVTVEDSLIDISVEGLAAACINATNVELINCMTKLNSFSSQGISAGLCTEGGLITVSGGVLEATALGPTAGENPSCAILAFESVSAPVIINADVKLSGNQAISRYPNISLFTMPYEMLSSLTTNASDCVQGLDEANLKNVKYLHIHPFYKIEFNANGGSGEMSAIENHYGLFTLPQNGFTAPKGKIFKGWAIEEDGKIIKISQFELHSNLILYAIWEDMSPEHNHSYSSEWMSDSANHWQECACGAKQNESAHSDSNGNGGCDICGYKMVAKEEPKGLSGGAIAGIVVGGVAVVGIGGFSVVWFIIKKKSFADLIAIFSKK